MNLLNPRKFEVSGTIRLAGIEVSALRGKAWRAQATRTSSLIFQDPTRSLNPTMRIGDQLVEAGDEVSLRQALELVPDHVGAVLGLAELLVGRSDTDGALDLLARIPETPETRALAARARLAKRSVATDDATVVLDALLDRVRDDEDARQEYLDLLEALGPEDPRTLQYRKALSSRLF